MQQHSHAWHAAWLAGAAVTQAIWGLYSVSTRYLQVVAAAPPFQLAAMLPILAWPVTLLICYAPWARGAAAVARAFGRCCGGGERRPAVGASPDDASASLEQAEAGAATAAAAVGAAAAKGALLTAPGAATLAAPAGVIVVAAKKQQQQHVKSAAVTDAGNSSSSNSQTWARWAQLQLLALAVGSIVALSALGLVCATMFVPAFLVQLVMVMIPLFTAVASRILLRAPTPYMLWPTLAAGAVGSVMAVVGSWLDGRSSGGVAALRAVPRGHLFAGVGISLGSAALFAAYFIALQATRHLLTTPQQVMASRHAAIIIMLPLALAVEGTQWHWLRALTMSGWLMLLFASLIAFNFGSIGLQWCTRALGGAAVAQLSCLRLVAAIAGSAVALHEAPRNALTWAGCAAVAASMILWVWLVTWRERRLRREAEADEGQQQQQQQQQHEKEQEQHQSKAAGDVRLAVGPVRSRVLESMGSL